VTTTRKRASRVSSSTATAVRTGRRRPIGRLQAATLAEHRRHARVRCRRRRRRRRRATAPHSGSRLCGVWCRRHQRSATHGGRRLDGGGRQRWGQRQRRQWGRPRWRWWRRGAALYPRRAVPLPLPRRGCGSGAPCLLAAAAGPPRCGRSERRLKRQRQRRGRCRDWRGRAANGAGGAPRRRGRRVGVTRVGSISLTAAGGCGAVCRRGGGEGDQPLVRHHASPTEACCRPRPRCSSPRVFVVGPPRRLRRR